MPPVFFFALLLPQRKLTLPLQFPLRFGANLPGSSPLLPLHAERLLGLGANTGLLELFPDLPLYPLGIYAPLHPVFNREGRAELQLVAAQQNILQYLAVLGSCPYKFYINGDIDQMPLNLPN